MKYTIKKTCTRTVTIVVATFNLNFHSQLILKSFPFYTSSEGKFEKEAKAANF